MAPSIKLPNPPAKPLHVRAGLLLAKVSVPRIAAKHSVPVSTLYAVINGKRPGRDAKVQAAVAEMNRLSEGALRA